MLIRGGYGPLTTYSVEFMNQQRELAPVNIVDDTIIMIKYGAGKQIDRLMKERKNHPYALELALYSYAANNTNAILLFIDKTYTRFGYKTDLARIIGIHTYTNDEVRQKLQTLESQLETAISTDNPPIGCENKQWWKPKGQAKAVPMKCRTLCPYKDICYEFDAKLDIMKMFTNRK